MYIFITDVETPPIDPTEFNFRHNVSVLPRAA